MINNQWGLKNMGDNNLTSLLHNSYQAAKRYVATVAAAATLFTSVPVYGEEVKNTPPYEIQLNTDKPSYKPGEKITFGFSAKDREGNMELYILRPTNNSSQQPIQQQFTPTDNLETTVTYNAPDSEGTYTAMLRVIDRTRVGRQDVLDQGTATVEYNVVREQPVATTSQTPNSQPSQACSDEAMELYGSSIWVANRHTITVNEKVSSSPSEAKSYDLRDLSDLGKKKLDEGYVLGLPDELELPSTLVKLLGDRATSFHITYQTDGLSVIDRDSLDFIVNETSGFVKKELRGKNCNDVEQRYGVVIGKYDLNKDKKAAGVVALIVGGILHSVAIGASVYCAEDPDHCQPGGTLPPQPTRGDGGITGDGSLIE